MTIKLSGYGGQKGYQRMVTREKNGALQYGGAHMIKEEETMATATLTAAMTAWKSIR